MILVIFGICVALVIGGCILAGLYNFEGLGVTTIIVGILGGIISVFIIIALIIGVVDEPAIKEEIALYETENAKIETIVTETVTAYQKYESDTFKEISEKNVMSAIVLYPELKSNTLVQEQIRIYNENNTKLKELQSKLIYMKVYKWWLYFGG